MCCFYGRAKFIVFFLAPKKQQSCRLRAVAQMTTTARLKKMPEYGFDVYEHVWAKNGRQHTFLKHEPFEEHWRSLRWIRESVRFDLRHNYNRNVTNIQVFYDGRPLSEQSKLERQNGSVYVQEALLKDGDVTFADPICLKGALQVYAY
jgi:hypothetical protein